MMMRSWKLRLGQLQESLLLQEGTNHVAEKRFVSLLGILLITGRYIYIEHVEHRHVHCW